MRSLCVVDRYRFLLSLQCDSALRVWVAAGVHFKSGKPRVNILGWMLNGCLGRGEGSYYFERMWLWARFRVIVWGFRIEFNDTKRRLQEQNSLVPICTIIFSNHYCYLIKVHDKDGGSMIKFYMYM